MRGFAGETRHLSTCDAGRANAWWRRRRAEPRAQRRLRQAGRAGAGAVQGVPADGRRARRTNARDRLYYVRLPPNYDPAGRTARSTSAPGAARRRTRSPTSQGLPDGDRVRSRRDPDRDGAGLLQQGRIQQRRLHRRPRRRAPANLCHYCFDDGAGTTSPESVEYGYFDLLHKRIENDFCVDTDEQFYAGYSSGGWMAHQLGCQFPDVLRAQASVTGGLPPVIRDGTKTCVDHPIAAFLIHDCDGPVEPVFGIGRGAGAAARAEQVRGRTTMREAPIEPYTITGVPNNADFNCLRYTGCPAEYPIVFCTSRGKIPRLADRRRRPRLLGVLQELLSRQRARLRLPASRAPALRRRDTPAVTIQSTSPARRTNAGSAAARRRRTRRLDRMSPSAAARGGREQPPGQRASRRSWPTHRLR